MYRWAGFSTIIRIHSQKDSFFVFGLFAFFFTPLRIVLLKGFQLPMMIVKRFKNKVIYVFKSSNINQSNQNNHKAHEDEISNIVAQLWTAGQQRTQLKSEVLVKIELYVCVPETRMPSVPREVLGIKR